MGELRQVHRVAAEGLLRRRRHGGERLRLRAPAEDHRQPLAHPDDAARARRRARRPLRDGAEPGGRLAARGAAAPRAGQAQVARGPRPLRARDRELLARRPRGALGRAAHGGHPDRGLPHARRRRTSRRTATSRTRSGSCSCTTRRSTRPATRAPSCGSCTTSASACSAHYAGSEAERDWPIVNLKWDYPEHGEIAEPDAEAVLKEINGYDVATGEPVPGFAQLKADGTPPAAAGSTPAASRTASTRRGAATRGTSTPPGRLGLARVGVGVAGQPPHPLQPRLGRPRGQAVVGAQEATSGGTRRPASGPATTSPTSPPTSRRTTSRTTTPRGWTRSRGTDPFIMMADGKGWLYSPAGLLDGPMPTHYEPLRVAGAEPALPGDRAATRRR